MARVDAGRLKLALELVHLARGRTLDIHSLRHTAATRFARNGTPLPVTQRILGHSDPKMTARVYTHFDVEDLREAVQGGRATGRAREVVR